MQMPTNDSALEISDLRINYKRKQSLFSNLSLRIGTGEFHVLMGENGAGKTSLFHCLLGIRQPNFGSISFFSKPLKTWNRHDLYQQVAWVGASREVYPINLRIDKFLEQLARFYPNWDKAFEQNLVAKFQLDLTKKLNHLSDGESTKVRLLKALAFRPKLLLLDELTANLSPSSAQAVTRSIIDLMSEHQSAVLYISHSQDEANRLADQTHYLNSNGIISTSNGEKI